MEILRSALQTVFTRLQSSPVVAILGPRQVGKTTLARQLASRWHEPVHFFDLEDPNHRARLSEPGLVLRDLCGLIVLDEIQLIPEIFPLLRVLSDRPSIQARFLVLGSAAPELLQQTSETLAGRIAFVPLNGLRLDEVGSEMLHHRWIRGGFPKSLLAFDDEVSTAWRMDFIRTFLERDLPQLGIGVSANTMRRFWTMLAHQQGQILNASSLARSFGVSDTSVRNYIDTLASTFMVRVLQPWHENIGKRQVKQPKTYLADTGVLHTLLGLDTRAEVESHPIVGPSWEGFALEQVIARLGVPDERCYFWGTHAGAELDLLVVSGGRRRGFEFKRTEVPKLTKSMHVAYETLQLDSLDVIYGGTEVFALAERIRAVPLERCWDLLGP